MRQSNRREEVSSFYCDIVKSEIKKPCNVKSCKMNIKHPYSYNCLVHYASTHDTPNMGEVAHFYDEDISVLRSIYQGAIEKVYENVFRYRNEQLVKLEYIPSTSICLVCESIAEDPKPVCVKYVVCAEHEEYPEYLWEKAIKYGMQVEDLLKLILKVFKTNSLVDRFFEARRGTAKDLRSRYA